MSRLVLALCIVVLIGCKQETQIYNQEAFWTQQEITELQSIVSSFDNALLAAYNTSSLSTAYNAYSQTTLEHLKNGSMLVVHPGMDVPIETMRVFHKIWAKYISDSLENASINLNPYGIYFKYLKALPNSPTLVDSYINRFELAGDLQPSFVFEFADQGTTLDYSNVNARLIFAVHYLTLFNR